MGEIIYNGKSSKTIGLEVETYPDYQTPRRSYEKIHIPGRNGDLLIDQHSWENATRTYLVSIGSFKKRYDQMMNEVSQWLHSALTYVRLEDSYEPEFYRLAVYLGENSFTNLFNQGGKATIEFDCKPQRFLKEGDISISVTDTTNLENPTIFTALPIIHVYGAGKGSLTVGNYPVTISEIGTEIVLDSEIQDAYLNTLNKNSMVSLENGFPKLEPGKTPIGFSGGITKVEVIPKWFTL